MLTFSCFYTDINKYLYKQCLSTFLLLYSVRMYILLCFMTFAIYLFVYSYVASASGFMDTCLINYSKFMVIHAYKTNKQKEAYEGFICKNRYIHGKLIWKPDMYLDYVDWVSAMWIKIFNFGIHCHHQQESVTDEKSITINVMNNKIHQCIMKIVSEKAIRKLKHDSQFPWIIVIIFTLRINKRLEFPDIQCLKSSQIAHTLVAWTNHYNILFSCMYVARWKMSLHWLRPVSMFFEAI